MNVESEPTMGLVGGNVATAMFFIGGVGILIKRMANKDLKAYYGRLYHVKWILILMTLGGGFHAVQFFFGASMVEVMNASMCGRC